MNFEVIVITPEENYPKETKVTYNLFKVGLKTLHLRKPNASIEELRAYIRSIPKQFHTRIVLHTHYTLAKEFDIKGVHLTEKTRKQPTVLAQLKREKVKIVSTSFHTYKDVLKSRRKYAYVFLSPVFDSISKQSYKSNFTSDELTLLLKKTKQHVIALGGIDDKNIYTTKQLNFYGAAALGYIWESKKPIESYKKLLSKIK